MMKTNVLTPRDLFQKEICYVIPEFQRPYVWDGDGRWGPLWENVQNTADRYLERLDQYKGDKAKAEGQTNPHFLGAVVVQQERTATDEIEQRVVVDGQQRITTLQLLLAAVEGVCKEAEKPNASKRLLKLVKNDEMYQEDDRYKLRPGLGDKEPFQRAIDAVSDMDSRDAPLVVQAYGYFRAQAAGWVHDGGPDEIGRRVEALEAAVTSLVHMVVIDLGELDDPHVIFETLNARGTPLLQSDLIKNYVISRLGENVQEGIWLDLEEDWWRVETPQGRLRRARIEVALHYWLTMRKADEVSASKMFAEFKGYAEDKDDAGGFLRDIGEVVRDIKSVLGKYRDFQERDDLHPDNKRFRDRIDVMQMGVVTPVLLRLLASYDQGDQRFVQSLYALESFLVRRMVCRMTTKDYNSLMQSLLRALDEADGAGPVDGVVAKFLKEQTADARMWPDDDMIKERFRELDIYRLLTRARLRLVLEGIEEELRADDNYAEPGSVPNRLSIEHVMPQAWRANWPLDPSTADGEEAERERGRRMHTIGNLTLTTSRLNASLSNAPWESKRQTLVDHSVLFLNKELVRHETWDEQAIAARSEALADKFAQAWPGPDSPYWES